MIAGLRRMGGLRGRIAALLMGGLLAVALGFYGLLDFLAREWTRRELADEGHGMVERLAADAATPLLLGDRGGLQQLVARESRDTDAVGAAILLADGREVAARVNEPRLWTPLAAASLPSPDRGPHASQVRRGGVDIFYLLAPVRRRSGDAALLVDELAADPSGQGMPESKTELIGWVRVAYSTARLEGDLATARQLGLLFLLLVLGLGLVTSLMLLRLVVRPLREASGLAREIADGNLDRRLPAGAGDELGTLAESMNSMAGALAESRLREQVEAAALRETAEAVVAIAQRARASRDPATMFRVVAEQLRRVTHCDGVALATPDPHGASWRFVDFEPPPPWGGLYRGALLDAPVAAALSGVDPQPIRLQTAAHTLPIAATLAGRGLGAALIVPLPLEAGATAALLLAARDTSAFRPAELRVVTGLASHLAAALHGAQLQDRLQKAIEDLRVTQEQLVRSERLRVAGELASGIAHEFNNVLAAILGRVQLLRLRAQDGTLAPQELQDAFGVMELAARDGAETVRRLRQFGKGEAADAADLVDLDAVLREAAEFTRPRWKNAAEGGGVHIELAVESSPGAWVRGNGAQLREVFTNLILNAVDAMPRGGIVRLGTATRDEAVVAIVEDDGVGMTPETMQRVFEPFFTTKGARGTGLGLSVVYGIVQRHGGKLTVRSEPGRGTRIELTFRRSAAATPVAAETVASVQGLSVMVVDDEPAVRQLLVDILEALGHRPVAYGSGEAALEDYRPGRFDLVLTDLGMPGVNGWELSRSLRAKDRGVAVAFVTGWGEEVDPAQVRGAGADAVVTKPFSIEDIMRVTRLAVERSRAHAA